MTKEALLSQSQSASPQGPLDSLLSASQAHVLAGLSAQDKARFVEFGQGKQEQVAFDFIHHAIEQHALLRPHFIAACHQGKHINYHDLNSQAEQLAQVLSREGISTGDRVGVFMTRSIELLVAMLACLKVGAAYVPQDARITPAQTMAEVINSADIDLVLTLSGLVANLPQTTSCKYLKLDLLDLTPAAQGVQTRQEQTSTKAALASNSHDLACFILFTSGTTGKPNGVKVTHQNVCNILLTEPGSLAISPGDKVSQLLNIAFDMASWEILGCLAHGGCLLIRGKDFTETAQAANVIIATPSILARIDKNACQQVHTVAVAGEPCPLALAEAWSAKCRFINSCGPTETTIINTAQQYRHQSGNLTIGKPTPNNRVYILDHQLKPCRIGDIGEIWAGGAGITAGYVNNPRLNQERYRLDPFGQQGQMMFRTRDLGRWNSQGELEHFGRTDDQVKIKGFRVELDAISTVLESLPTCQQAVTLQLDKNSVVSFVRPSQLSKTDCIKAVNAKLPYYCVPAQIICLDRFPVTARGKTDKSALLQMVQQLSQSPLTSTTEEEVL